MTTATELRLCLRRAGYDPLPLNGKRPAMDKWQTKVGSNDDEIRLWSNVYPHHENTGIITRRTPALDLDILNPEAAEAAEELVRENFEEGGYVLPRIGLPPKRAFLFRTDEFFQKITVDLVAPNGGAERIEFLADGQQLACFGIHPDTKRPYSWPRGEPGQIAREELPYIREAEARQLVEDIIEMLVRQYGYRRKTETKGNGKDHTEAGERRTHGSEKVPFDWGKFGDLIDHDSLVSSAMALIAHGLEKDAAYNLLRSLVEAIDFPDIAKKQRRLDELRGIVNSAAAKKFEQQTTNEQKAQEPPSGNDGAAFGYSWHLAWHGEDSSTSGRKWSVMDLLPETGVALISGQWGTYKTFIANDLSAALMTATHFANKQVMRKGGVLFLACEGQSEVNIRLTAAFRKRGGTGNAPFAWVQGCPRLLDQNADKILAAMVKHAAVKMTQDFGLPVAMVVIDTAGKAAGLSKSGELNDDAIAKSIMRVLAEASTQTGALFVGVAHFGKNVETGTKGSTGFEDDADVVLALLGERGINGVVTNPVLCVRKRKSGPNGEELPFQTEEAEVPNGNVIIEKTLTIRWTDALDGTAAAKPKKKDDPWAVKSLRHLRQTLMNILADCGSQQRPYPDGPMVQAVDLEVVRAEFHKSYPATGDEAAKKETRKKAFNRAIESAHDKRLIGSRDIGATTFVWLADPSPSSASTAHHGAGI